MKTKIFFVAYSIGLITCLNSCAPKEKEKCYVSPIEPAMKDFLFNEGSYWVYKNDSTNETDTILLLNIVDTILGYPYTPPMSPVSIQYVMATYKRTSNQKQFSEVVRDIQIYRATDFYYGADCPDSISAAYCNQGVFVYYKTTYSTQTFSYNSFTPVLNINGVDYYNVREFGSVGADYNSSCSIGRIKTFYSPQIGLIKFTELDSLGNEKSFSLLNYQSSPFLLINPCKQ